MPTGRLKTELIDGLRDKLNSDPMLSSALIDLRLKDIRTQFASSRNLSDAERLLELTQQLPQQLEVALLSWDQHFAAANEDQKKSFALKFLDMVFRPNATDCEKKKQWQCQLQTHCKAVVQVLQLAFEDVQLNVDENKTFLRILTRSGLHTDKRLVRAIIGFFDMTDRHTLL